jgi:hypothetical protein
MGRFVFPTFSRRKLEQSLEFDTLPLYNAIIVN